MNSELTPEAEKALHERWISEIELEWAPLFQQCGDALYIYIDDEHKTCNEKCAQLFGLTVQEFKATESLLDQCVAEDSVELVIHHYFQHFVEEKRPMAFEAMATKRDGTEFPVTLFNIPIVHDGQLMLLCFVREHS